MTTQEEPARLSFIVPGDRPGTIRRMRDALRKQTARGSLEIIVVRWPEASSEGGDLEGDGFAAVRFVDVADGTSLPEARAAGARAATAPLVFIGETHAFPRPEWAESVLTATESGAWEIVSSSFANANPEKPVSWAGFIMDYGAYANDLPAGEIEAAPIHKGIFQRADLLDLGERLVPALSSGDELSIALHARGRRAYLEPRAEIDHLNVSSLGTWLRGRCLIGFLIGANRSERWSFSRRAVYALLSPMIVVVLLIRALPTARRIGRSHRLPAGTHGAMLLGAIARASGEAIAYAFGRLPLVQAKADTYELFESVYAGACSLTSQEKIPSPTPAAIV